ncbi:hypothetical protein HYDPIDRAFT_25012 [Hydnomerulius pinastri MD-312]|nr:hypothetical protein HYDPIDRAFT_25012 [Hydnomerulius pinastri MD-312]
MPIPPNEHSNLINNVYRRGTSSSGSFSRTTTIIIIVVCIVACLMILFALFRFLHRSWGQTSTPLPPRQPIAHHREQQLSEFAERSGRPTSWFDPTNLSAPLGLSPAGSDSSLLHTKEGEGFSSHRTSPNLPDNGYYPRTPQCSSPLPYGPDDLQMPNPSFGEGSRRNSSSSMGSNSSMPPSVSARSSPTQASFTRPIPRQPRPRPLSMMSTNSVRSTSNRNTIVGVPHGPHSQVKIVLPSPLAPALHPYITRSGPDVGFSGSDNLSGSVRNSVVDMWAPTLHRSASSDYIGPTGVHPTGRSSNPSLPSRLRTVSSNIDSAPPSSYPLSPLASPPFSPERVSEDGYFVGRGRPQASTSPSAYFPQIPAPYAQQPPASPLRQSHQLQKPPPHP